MGDFFQEHVTGILLIGAALIVILVVPPLRALAGWVLKDLGVLKFLGGYIKTILHAVWDAHMTVLRNFMPRQRIFPTLAGRRTSETEDRRGVDGK